MGLGIGASVASTGPDQPILTKSGQRAAIQAAGAAVRQGSLAAQAQALSSAMTAGAMPATAPTSPIDQTKVPHYFGPFPNWANSPLTLPDVDVAITGAGTGATATATVGARGEVIGLAITNPGEGYCTDPDLSVCGATVTINGAGYAVPRRPPPSPVPMPVVPLMSRQVAVAIRRR